MPGHPPTIPPPASSGHTATTAEPLYWCTYGHSEAPRLLVLHGGPGAHHDYLLPQMLELTRAAGGRELLFYDQRGGGRSRGDTRGAITWQTHVEDAGALLREFGMDAPTIVGYSWGGLLAMLYAAAASRAAAGSRGAPDMPLPARLVLVDPAPVTREFRRSFEAEFARRQSSGDVVRQRQELADSGLREADPEAYRQRNFELSVAGYFLDPAMARDLTPFRVTARVQQSVWESLGDYDLVADGTLEAIRIPTLILHGRQDPIPLASSQAAAPAIGGGGFAELAIIEDCGHVPYVEQPAALFSRIDEYLRQAAT